MSLEDRLIAEGIIRSVHPHQSSSSRSSQSSRLSQPSRPPPFNTTQKLLEQGLLVEEQITPSRTNRLSRHFRKLSSASTLIPDNMDRPSSSSSNKWYNSRRLSFSSRNKKEKDSNRYPDPEQLRQQAQSPQEIFEEGLGKNFDLRRLGGLQTIRRAPKNGL